MTVRKACADDIGRVAELYGAVCDHLAGKDYNPGWRREYFPTALEAEYFCRNDALYIAESGGEVIGSIALTHSPNGEVEDIDTPIEREFEDVMFIHILAVHPEYHGRGTASALLDFAHELAWRDGADVMRLYVYDKNYPAINAYEKNGYIFRGKEDIGLAEFGLDLFCLYERPLGIQTDRLRLRRLRRDDLEPMHAILSDGDIMAHYPHPFSREETEQWIERNIARYKEDGFGLWAVELKDTGEFIGDCGITMQCINGEALPEIGYHIAAQHQRRGYASEAAAACIEYAFSALGFERVYSYMKHTNAASAAVAQKNGMSFVCEYPDPVNTLTRVYAIGRDEWEQRKPH